MNRLSLFFGLIMSLVFISCDDLQKREQELIIRENDLNRREQLFKEKEAEYYSLLKERDSILSQDSIVKINRWPDNLLGQWSSRIVCVETNCNDYVVGDTRNDTWEFVQDSAQLHVNVYSKSGLIRVYDGKYIDNQITLRYATDTTAQKFVEMKVYLNEIDSQKISGFRTVSVNNQCSAKFTVELNKVSN